MRRWLCVTLILAAFVCASCEPPQRTSDRPTAISYSHAGCYGSCPSFEIQVDATGRGKFEGRAYTAVHGKREFHVTPQQFKAFADALQGARRLAQPFDKTKNVFEQINAKFVCPPSASYSTDAPGVFIMWSETGGDVFYNVDYGCDADSNKRLYDSLDEAPNALGVNQMIGTPQVSI